MQTQQINTLAQTKTMQPEKINTSTQIPHSISPINPETILKHDDSPTAIILAITILITTLMGSVTTLVQIMLRGMAQRSKPYR